MHQRGRRESERFHSPSQQQSVMQACECWVEILVVTDISGDDGGLECCEQGRSQGTLFTNSGDVQDGRSEERKDCERW